MNGEEMNSYINLYALRGNDGVNYIMPSFMNGIDRLMKFMMEVIYGDALFHTVYKRMDGRCGKTISSLGNHLESLHSYSQIYSGDYKYSPLIDFFFEQYRKHQIKDYAFTLDKHDADGLSIELFNDFVTMMRSIAITTNLKKKVADWTSKPKKNMKRLIEFEADLFQRHARLIVIRLDFNYHKSTFTREEVEEILAESGRRKELDQANYLAGNDISNPSIIEGRVALEEVQKDRERLFTNMKGKPTLFKYLVGYVWRIEFTRGAGYHLHVFLFFDRTQGEKHEHLAQKVGYYWRDVITLGRSYFENCNMKKSRYGDAWALGQIDHWDGVKRDKLRYAMQYFCKTSQLVQVVPYAKCHLFGCGFVHRQGKPKVGRPRTRALVGADHQRLDC